MAFLGITHAHGREMIGAAATSVVAAMVAVVFAGSTLVTPLYVIYERQLEFSRITLTLIYAAYLVGNLAALLFFGGWSDRIGRRQTALPAITVAIISALVFCSAAMSLRCMSAAFSAVLGLAWAPGPELPGSRN